MWNINTCTGSGVACHGFSFTLTMWNINTITMNYYSTLAMFYINYVEYKAVEREKVEVSNEVLH